MRGWGALKVAGLGAAVAVLLTGCIKLDVDMKVQGDDTIDGRVTIGVSKQLLQFVPGGAADLGGLLTGNEGGSPEIDGAQDVKVTAYDDGRFVGQTVSFTGVPLEQASSGLGDGSGDLTIDKEGDRYRLQGTLDLTQEDAGLPADVPLPDLSTMFDEAEIRIKVTFPGPVVESNGSVEGCSVTWEPEFGQEVDLDATAKTSGGCGGGMQWWSWVLIGLGAAVVIGAIVAIVFSILYERRRHRRLASADAAAAAVAATAAGPPLEPVPASAFPPPDATTAATMAAPVTSTEGEVAPDAGPAEAADAPETEPEVPVPDAEAPTTEPEAPVPDAEPPVPDDGAPATLPPPDDQDGTP